MIIEQEAKNCIKNCLQDFERRLFDVFIIQRAQRLNRKMQKENIYIYFLGVESTHLKIAKIEKYWHKHEHIDV